MKPPHTDSIRKLIFEIIISHLINKPENLFSYKILNCYTIQAA